MDFPLFWFLSDSYTHISPTKEYKCELYLMIGGPQTFRPHIRSKYEPFLSFTYLALNPLLPPGSGKEPIVRRRIAAVVELVNFRVPRADALSGVVGGCRTKRFPVTFL